MFVPCIKEHQGKKEYCFKDIAIQPHCDSPNLNKQISEISEFNTLTWFYHHNYRHIENFEQDRYEDPILLTSKST